MSGNERILIVKLSSLGDTLHALPAVAALRTSRSARIDWAVQPEFAALVRAFSCVDEVIEVPRPSDFSGWLRALSALRRRQRYDLVVDMQGLAKSAVVARAARASRRLGPPFARECSSLFYDALFGRPEKPRRRHAVDECLDLLDFLDIPRPAVPEFPLDAAPADLSKWTPGASADSPAFAVAPYSRWHSKNWPEERFAEAIALLVRDRGARVFVLGGKGDRAGAERIIARSGVQAVNLCGELSITESAGVMRACRALLTNDSGPMHIAAALGVKTVAVFGPTVPGRTGPYGANHAILRADCCTPCRKRECPRGDHACMKAISAAQAVAALFGEKENAE